MLQTASKIRFRAKLFRPAATANVGSWTFLTLPKNASAKLPSRGMTTIEGTINGFPFRATLEPDGQRSHWLRVNRKMREAAGANAGDVVTLEISPSGEELESKVPADLREALAGRAEGAGVVVGHYAHRAQRLDTLDHLRQAARDSRASDRQCLCDARCREAARLLLRSVWDL
jgi:Domain of unknown function (DUF1905)